MLCAWNYTSTCASALTVENVMRVELYVHLRIGGDESEANLEPYGTKLDPGWSRDLQRKLVRADKTQIRKTESFCEI